MLLSRQVARHIIMVGVDYEAASILVTIDSYHIIIIQAHGMKIHYSPMLISGY